MLIDAMFRGLLLSIGKWGTHIATWWAAASSSRKGWAAAASSGERRAVGTRPAGLRWAVAACAASLRRAVGGVRAAGRAVGGASLLRWAVTGVISASLVWAVAAPAGRIGSRRLKRQIELLLVKKGPFTSNFIFDVWTML